MIMETSINREVVGPVPTPDNRTAASSSVCTWASGHRILRSSSPDKPIGEPESGIHSCLIPSSEKISILALVLLMTSATLLTKIPTFIVVVRSLRGFPLTGASVTMGERVCLTPTDCVFNVGESLVLMIGSLSDAVSEEIVWSSESSSAST